MDDSIQFTEDEAAELDHALLVHHDHFADIGREAAYACIDEIRPHLQGNQLPTDAQYIDLLLEVLRGYNHIGQMEEMGNDERVPPLESAAEKLADAQAASA